MKKNDISALENCPVFKSTPFELIKELLTDKQYTVSQFPKGENIFSPDCFSRSLAVILKGSAEVWKNTEKGMLYMSTLKEGNVFGMSCLFYDGESFPTSITAKENLRILFITKQQLTDIFSRYPAVTENYITILSKKIHFLNEKIESISAPDSTAALKAYLLDTAKKVGANEFLLTVSYSKLSSVLAIGRTSVYRAFDELIADGFIEKDGKKITVKERI